MDKNLIKNEIIKLREEIDYHNKLYYDKSKNTISDYEYDKKMNDLINLEKMLTYFTSVNDRRSYSPIKF